MTNQNKNSSRRMVKRIITLNAIVLFLFIILIYIFTKSTFYSIICSLGAFISILSFISMVKMTDRVLIVGKGRLLFVVTYFVKLTVILTSLYIVARFSGKAVLFYILGLSTLVVAIAMEGVYQFFYSRNKHPKRSIINGRA